MITREATLKDLHTLLEFEQGIIAAERPFDGTLKEGEIHYYDLSMPKCLIIWDGFKCMHFLLYAVIGIECGALSDVQF